MTNIRYDLDQNHERMVVRGLYSKHARSRPRTFLLTVHLVDLAHRSKNKQMIEEVISMYTMCICVTYAKRVPYITPDEFITQTVFHLWSKNDALNDWCFESRCSHTELFNRQLPDNLPQKLKRISEQLFRLNNQLTNGFWRSICHQRSAFVLNLLSGHRCAAGQRSRITQIRA